MESHFSPREVVSELDKFKELIQKVIHYNIHDPSFKNLLVRGICHFQYSDQSIYESV